MKIFCVGRNYSDHAKELNNPVPSEPLIFMKPKTSLLIDSDPFYIPSFSENVHYEAELVFKMRKNGKFVSPKFAHSYFGEISLGIDFTARDLQDKLKKKGHPWELAKAFDKSAAIGRFIALDSLDSDKPIAFRLERNGEIVQQATSADMIFSVVDLVSFISTYFTLNVGDLLYTGTPAGVGKVKVGDHFTGFINDQQLLDCKIK